LQKAGEKMTENRKEIEEFVRVNEKMNSSLVTDWSKKMILDAIEIYNQENQKKLLINFCDWWDKNYFKNDDSVTEEDLGIGANEVDEFLANLNEI